MSEVEIDTSRNDDRYNATVEAEKYGCSFPNLKRRFKPPTKASQQQIAELRAKSYAQTRATAEFKQTPQGDARDILLEHRFQDGINLPITVAIPSVVKETTELMMTCLQGHNIRGKKAVFVVGATGSGKSTLCNWLVGHGLEIIETEVEDDFGPPSKVHELNIKFITDGRPQFAVSGENFSKTFVPTLYEMKDNRVIIDFPGFFDTSAFDIRLGMDLGFRRLLNAFQGRVRVIALVAVDNFGAQNARGVAGKAQLEKMRRLVPTASTPVPSKHRGQNKFCLGVGRCDSRFVKEPRKLWENMDSQVKSLDNVMHTCICNVSKHMFKNGRGVMTPDEFLENLDQHFHVDGKVEGDCLDAKDVETFERVLKSNAFTEHLVSRIMSSVMESKDVVREDTIDPETADDSVSALAKVTAKAGATTARVSALSRWIVSASSNLTDHGALALGSVDETLLWLEKQEQPRLIRALANVEKALMSNILLRANTLHSELAAQTQDLIDKNLITADDAVKVTQAIKANEEEFNKLATKLGYNSSRTFIAGGAASVLIVGGGLVYAAAAVSATVYTAAGLCTGGLGLVIGGAAYAFLMAAQKKSEAEADEKDLPKKISFELCEKTFKALGEHLNAAKASADHILTLLAKTNAMEALMW